LFIILSCFLFVFIYGVISKVELRLKKSRKDLDIEIVERTKAEGRLLALLDEKEVLLKEIHHRVKNNLQIVYSLFRLQLRQIDDPRAIEILTDSQSRISAMALVHKTLYQPKKQSSIYLKEYIQELAASIFESYGVIPELITLKTSMDPISMDIDTVMPIGLIINELVANSIKYAFPKDQAGEIEIVLAKKKNGDYLIQVSDNGIGLPDNFDPRETSSLGLQLVINLTENQLMGEIEVDGSHGGTRISITFAEPPKKCKV
jgi:two-component sensor histidine kinase